jgi:tetratricopeptide (TPR) repeat protein
VAQICARLDGIPLAIELAAALVGSLSVEGIAARLDDLFRLLTGGARDALPRQRTLRAMLDWSYDLLSEPEQALLDRLSVFAGGCTLAAAAAVCAGEGVEDWEVLDLLDRLVNKSLVQTEEADGELRYTLLETMRQHGQERLAAGGGAAPLRDRHLAWYLALAEEAAPHLRSVAEVIWLDRLGADHDNLRVALRWARERGAGEEGLRLAGRLGFFWLARGNFREGRGWLEDALARGTGGTAARARALEATGDLAHWQGDFEDAAACFEQSLALYRALGDRSGVALSLHRVAIMVERQGDYARATLLQEESLALCREVGDREGIATALDQLAWVAYLRGDYKRATALYEESMALHREAGTLSGVAYCLNGLACVAEREGEYARAAAIQEEALALWQAVGSGIGITWTLVNLGWALLAQGEDERATMVLEGSLPIARQVGYFHGVPYALSCLGWTAYRRGEYRQAVALQEEALARPRQVGYRWGIARVLAALGCVVQAQGEYAQAVIYLKEGLQISNALGAQGLLAEALEGMVWVAMAEGRAARAARLGGAAEVLRETLSAALHPVLRPGHDRAVQAMCAALGEAAFTVTWAEGRALPLDEAVALALEQASATT